jgi:hypothetical protein
MKLTNESEEMDEGIKDTLASFLEPVKEGMAKHGINIRGLIIYALEDNDASSGRVYGAIANIRNGEALDILQAAVDWYRIDQIRFAAEKKGIEIPENLTTVADVTEFLTRKAQTEIQEAVNRGLVKYPETGAVKHNA